jgi:hypothetical protein
VQTPNLFAQRLRRGKRHAERLGDEAVGVILFDHDQRDSA